MEPILTPDEIAQMRQYVAEHAADPAYDDKMAVVFDGDVPAEQLLTRAFARTLARLDKEKRD